MFRKFGSMVIMGVMLGLASSAMAGSLTVGNFEGGLDGWFTDQYVTGTISQSATGATVGTQAMLVQGPGGWKQQCKINAKPYMEALGKQGVKVTADVTAFAADMTVTYFEIGWTLNAQGDDQTGPQNNIGWNQQEGPMGVALDGQPHQVGWVLPADLVDKIAGADQGIWWFELQLFTNADATATVKFYVDNVQISSPDPTASLMIGNFENGSLDNWSKAWETTPVVLANATIGATSGSSSLSLTTTDGYWCLQWNAPSVPASLAGMKLQFDLTMIASEWPVGRWTKVADKIALNSNGPSAWKEYTTTTAIDMASGATTGLDWGRWWDTAPDVAKTCTLDISDYDVTGATWFQINISIQGGDGLAHFYFDNIRLVSPAPAPSAKSTDFVIGNWEDTMDGWVAGAGADIIFAVPGTEVGTSLYEPNGVTLDNYSLDVYLPDKTDGWLQGILTLNLLDANQVDDLAAFKANTKISVDVTRKAANYPTEASPGWDEIALVINTGGDGWSGWYQLPVQVGWRRSDGDRTQTATWDYSQYLTQMQLNNLWWLELIFISNSESAYTANYWRWFYLDNMRLTGGGVPMGPQPVDRATDVNPDTLLAWTGGAYAKAHDVYIGTDRAAVLAAKGNSDPTVTVATVDGASFDPKGLAFNTRYFWRVEAVDTANPDSPWAGPVWSFTTGNFKVVDDFERYLDVLDGVGAIFDTWKDGLGNLANNGCYVGNADPPYAKDPNAAGTAHSGEQLMPFYYGQSAAPVSEATRTWADPQPWSSNAFNSLALFIAGESFNVPGTLYVTIKDNAGVTGTVERDISEAGVTRTWTRLDFAFSEFAGVNFGAVKTMVIGIKNKPGAAKANGTLLIDDIRLYRPKLITVDPNYLPVPKTAVAPVIDGVWDAAWNAVAATDCLITQMSNTDSAAPENAADLSAKFKAMYDATNFYFFIEVKDSVIDRQFSDWQGDGLEIYFDGDYSHGETYDGVNDNQIRITVDDTQLTGVDSSVPIDGTVFKVLTTAGGYNIEVAFPLSVLQIVPSADRQPLYDAQGVVIPGSEISPNNIIGFEVQINDNDGGGVRQTLLRWFSDDNGSYGNPSLFGQARLVP